MSDQLLINLFGLMTINANGIYAIGAAIHHRAGCLRAASVITARDPPPRSMVA